MKKLLLLLLIATASLNLSAQDDKYGKGSMPFVDGKVVFTEIVPAEGKTADQLYTQAKLAITDMFKSAKDVIQLDDKENGMLIVKGITAFTYGGALSKSDAYINFTLNIATKDGRYKIDMSNMSIYFPPTTIGSNVISASTSYAENMTDENCFNKKGELKKTGYGFHRTKVIDAKDRIFATLKEKMSNSAINNNNDW